MKYHYPECKTVGTVENWFGRELLDPYSWLKNAKDPEVLDFVARENTYTDDFFPSDELGVKIAELKADALPTLPTGMVPWRGGYLAGKNESGIYSIVTLDAQLNETGALPAVPAIGDAIYFSASPCPKDDSVLAIMTMKPGAPRLTIAVCNIDTKALIHEVDLVFGCVWGKADGCLYYSVADSNAEAQTCTTTLHRYDPANNSDAVVYEDTNYAIFGQEHASHDGSYVLAAICQDYSMARWVAVDCRSGSAHVLTDKLVEWIYLDTLEDRHYFINMMTDGARGEVICLDNSGRVQVVMAEDESRVLESGFVAGGRLFVNYRQDVNSRLMELASGRDISLPSPYGDLSVAGDAEGGRVLLKFESFVQAPNILLFDGCAMTRIAAASDEEHPDVIVEQRFAPSAGDGKLIPYYIVYGKGAKQDGNNRTLMYGYGGYNISMPPSYKEAVSQTVISKWVENGGVYVQCSLRGGNEYGSKWHEDGMMMTKRHCYEDFIGITEKIISDGWTSPKRITISGCSNGGLLMSTLVTMRPDLWGCVIDSVPHTDMIHFAEDDRGPMYITEYGNPRESKEMFEYLLSYSPYYNVRETEYPPTYIQTGELDNNVPPYHGKKFAARMQAMNRSDDPILLRVLAEGSHDRGKGEVYWRTIAEMHLFIDYAMKERCKC